MRLARVVSVPGHVRSVEVWRLFFLLLLFTTKDSSDTLHQLLLLVLQLVAFPQKVSAKRVYLMTLHALAEEIDAVLVVGLLFELNLSTVLHVLFELSGLAFA